MQRHAYIVNTSRGEVIDEMALAAALRARDIAGAGLDVFEHEPAGQSGPARMRQRHASCRTWGRRPTRGESTWVKR